MKFLGLGFALLVLVVVGVFTAHTQTSQTAAVPTRGDYTIISASKGQYVETYVLDTRSGRVWAMRGQVSEGPSLIPCFYSRLDGHTALSPIDGDQEPIDAKEALKKKEQQKDDSEKNDAS